MPPVASTTARARIGERGAVASADDEPRAAPSWVTSEVAASGSNTRMRSWVAASADSSRVMRRPVAAPPAWTIRRREWPPSRPSASLPERSASNCTPSSWRSWTRAADSSHSTRTALSLAQARPAAIVSAMWAALESSGASAAAIPPCAQ